KVSKRVKAIRESVDVNKEYSIAEAINILKQNSKVKFTESLDCAIRLGVDPRHADQMIRGTVYLPHGTGKQVRVLVITKGSAKEAIDASVDYARIKEYLEKIYSGLTDMDVIITTPDSMRMLSKLARVLGPKRLMPSPSR